jgi:hypothetical protein
LKSSVSADSAACPSISIGLTGYPVVEGGISHLAHGVHVLQTVGIDSGEIAPVKRVNGQSVRFRLGMARCTVRDLKVACDVLARVKVRRIVRAMQCPRKHELTHSPATGR